MSKYKRIILISFFLFAAGLGILEYRNWRHRKEILELIQTSVASKQQRYISDLLNPYLGFQPELRQNAAVAIMETVKIESYEHTPIVDNQMRVRYQMSIVSADGARDLSDKILRMNQDKKFLSLNEVKILITDQIDKALPRQLVIGELQLTKVNGVWKLSEE